MRYAIIENGKVANIVESEGILPGHEMVPDDGTAQIGGGWDGSAFSAPVISIAEWNAPILAALDVLDAKSIRPLRSSDTARVAALESQAAALRLQLRK